MNGVDGIIKEDFVVMNRESYKYYVNLGGIDYIGRGPDHLRSNEELEATAHICKKLGLTGLIMVGATDTMTDGVKLSQYLLD